MEEQKILEALSMVEDPDLKQDLVSLHMIQNLAVEEGSVRFDLVLTTPACPMKDLLERACRTAIATMVDPTLDVQIRVTSKVTTQREQSELLRGVRNVIAVASGKGGVGKSTISIGLARSLAASGAKVGILDADIHGPSIPVLMGVEGEKPAMLGQKILPVDAEGVKMMSIGFLVPKEQAIVWRGPMLASALKQFAGDVEWGPLDYLVVDLPPGTGDVHLSLIQLIPLDGVVVVTSPDDVSVADTRKSLNMLVDPQLKQEVLGIVENMSYFKPDDSDKEYHLFGKDGGLVLATEFDVELLSRIPIVEKGKERSNSEHFSQLAGKVAQKLSIKHARS